MLMSLLMMVCCLAMQSKEELEGRIQEVSSLKGEKAEAVHQRGQLQKRVTSLQKEMSDATQLHGTTAQVGEALSVYTLCAICYLCCRISSRYPAHCIVGMPHSMEPVMISTFAYLQSYGQ